MKLLGMFATALVVLAAAQAAAVVIGLALALGLVVAVFTAPGETFAFLITMSALGIFAAAPLPTLALIALGVAIKLLRQLADRSSPRLPSFRSTDDQ